MFKDFVISQNVSFHTGDSLLKNISLRISCCFSLF